MITFDSLKQNITVMEALGSHKPKDTYKLSDNWVEFLTEYEKETNKLFKTIYKNHSHSNLLKDMVGYGILQQGNSFKTYIVDFDHFIETGEAIPLKLNDWGIEKLVKIVEDLIQDYLHISSKDEVNYNNHYLGYTQYNTTPYLSETSINSFFIPFSWMNTLVKFKKAKKYKRYYFVFKKLKIKLIYYSDGLPYTDKQRCYIYGVNQTVIVDSKSKLYTTNLGMEITDYGIVFHGVKSL